jgi:hypothetical protein
MVAWGSLGVPLLVFSLELAPIHRWIEALKRFARDIGLLALDQACWSANPLGLLWPERDAAFTTSGGENGGGRVPATVRRPVVIVTAG